MPDKRFASILLLALLLSAPLLAVQAGRPTQPISPAAAARGDRHLDLAIGVPGEDIGDTAADAGAAHVVYAKINGLYPNVNQLWDQNDFWGDSESETFDGFGSALASGDFDGDGWDDLAVGVPGEDVSIPGYTSNAGIVQVLYGTAAGLSTAHFQIWCQGICDGLHDTAEENDAFGSALAAGDFNGDGYDDLAVGVPGEDVVTKTDAGAVSVVYGSPDGLSLLGTVDQFWHQDSPDVEGGAEAYDKFGTTLAAADFDGDGYDDLAIGVPYEHVGDIADAGAVNILYGTGSVGLSATDDEIWDQGPLENAPGELDLFGYALAAGDLDGNPYADLAVGVRNEDMGTVTSGGAVNVLYGSSVGLSTAGDQYFDQDTGLLDAAEDYDFFGSALAIGDLDGDGYDDLAVGVPREDVRDVVDAGAINIIFGTDVGLSTYGNIYWDQDYFVYGFAETEDEFGHALAAGDIDGDGYDDLVVGVPYQHVSGMADAGSVDVLYGSGYWPGGWLSGLSQDLGGMGGQAETGDHFGTALTLGDWRGFRAHLPLSLKRY